jgi:hypothetical protein
VIGDSEEWAPPGCGIDETDGSGLPPASGAGRCPRPDTPGIDSVVESAIFP